MKKIKIDRAIQERPATRKQTRNEKIRQSLTEHVDVQVIPAITDREGYEKPKLRVCAYCRVSTDMDTQALSYELQVQNYTDYIRGNDEWQFAGIYADRGISGTSLKHRDEFNRMIEDCKAGKIDLIITKAVTRFARNVLDCISTIRMLKQLEHPVAVYFETERINTLDTTSETYLGLISLFAQGESESKSESLKWSYIRRWKRGTGIYPAWSLLGYEMGEDGKWQIVEAEAELVRIIYDMYLNGYSSPQIAEILTRSGVPTATNQTVWSSGGVLGILRNEKYCGNVLCQKTMTVDVFSHIEKKDVFSAPEYDAEFISIPGRSGDIINPNRRFANIKVTYTVFLARKNIAALAAVLRDIKGWLYSEPDRYHEITDSYDAEYFRYGVISGSLDIEEQLNKVGSFTVTFNCKPYKYSFAGQQTVSADASVLTITNPTAFESRPYIKLYGSGTVVIMIQPQGRGMMISDLDEYIEIDSELMNCFKDTILKNDTVKGAEFPVFKPGVCTINCNGDVSRIEVVPRWCCL